MTTLFRRTLAALVLLSFAGQPLSALAYSPLYLVADASGVPAGKQAADGFQRCTAKAMLVRDLAARNAKRDLCYAVLADALRTALNNSQETRLAVDYGLGMKYPSERGAVGTVDILQAIQVIRNKQSQAADDRKKMAALLPSAGGTSTSQLEALRAKSLATAKEYAKALSESRGARAFEAGLASTRAETLRRQAAAYAKILAALTAIKALEVRIAAARTAVDALVAKYGFPSVALDDASILKRLESEELAFVAAQEDGALIVATADAQYAARKSLEDGWAYAYDNPGKAVLIGSAAIIVVGATAFCVAASAGVCAPAVAAVGGYFTADSVTVVLTQKNIFGKPASDDEWGQAVLMLPVMAAPAVASALKGGAAALRTASASLKTALRAKFGAQAADDLAALALRGEGVAKSAAIKQIDQVAQESGVAKAAAVGKAAPVIKKIGRDQLSARVKKALEMYQKGKKEPWNWKYKELGTKAGGPWENGKGQLPKGSYREYDVNPKAPGHTRDSERFVVDWSSGKPGKVYYTDNHYGDTYNGNPDFFLIQ